ncbi:MAG: hypothetical protein ACPG5B_10975 [Chitinophagales bacterium]
MLANKKNIKLLAVFAFLQTLTLLFFYQKLSKANTDTASVLKQSNKSLENFVQQTYTNRGCAMQALDKDMKKNRRGKREWQLADGITAHENEVEMQLDSLLRVLHSTKKVKYSAGFRQHLYEYYEQIADILDEKNVSTTTEIWRELKSLQATETDFEMMENNSSVQEQLLFLNKLKTDALLANFNVVFYLYKNLKKMTESTYNGFEPAVVLSKKRIEQGETLEAKIYLTAFSAKARPKISVNGKSLELNEKGMAFYEQKADKIGTFPVKAAITTTTGQQKTIIGEVRYEVKKTCR